MRRIWGMTLAAMLMTAPAAADDWADGVEAYDGGRVREALDLWRRAAARGNIDAMTAIAGLYTEGEGVPRDAALARRWYRRAAVRGDTSAQLNLGDMMDLGIGGPRDRVAAFLWLGLAANAGNDWSRMRQRQVSDGMSLDEIAEGERRIAGWKPVTD